MKEAPQQTRRTNPLGRASPEVMQAPTNENKANMTLYSSPQRTARNVRNSIAGNAFSPPKVQASSLAPRRQSVPMLSAQHHVAKMKSPSLVGFDPLLPTSILPSPPFADESMQTKVEQSPLQLYSHPMPTKIANPSSQQHDHNRLGAFSSSSTPMNVNPLSTIVQDVSVPKAQLDLDALFGIDPSLPVGEDREPTPTGFRTNSRADERHDTEANTSPRNSSPRKRDKTAALKQSLVLTPKRDPSAPSSPEGTPIRDAEKSGKSRRFSLTYRPKNMRWIRMGSKRHAKSVDREEIPPSPPRERSAFPLPPSEANSNRSSMYPSMIQDMMELNIDKLEIPSLAKPSPTSFLTGKEDEVVRTSELDPSPHQMEIPSLPEFVLVARINQFVENFRRIDQNFDLAEWVNVNQMELKRTSIAEHQPIVQALAECGSEIMLQGFVAKGSSVDDRTEMAIFEGQRQFIVVFRGTTEQQCKPGASIKPKKGDNKNVSSPLDLENESVEIFSSVKEEYTKLEKDCIEMLDRLSEQNPFCDVLFTGHSFGAAVATVAAYKYANARPMMRVSCMTIASPQVGFASFRRLVNSTPNLRMMRLEIAQDGKCKAPNLGGSHVGHTIVLNSAFGNHPIKTNNYILAFKFDTPQKKKFKTIHPDLSSYVNALQEISRLGLPWVRDFVGTSGQGVVVNDEARLVV